MTRFDPQKHHRRSIRLQGYDYTQPGAYFVTIVTRRRELLFGDVHEDSVFLNTFGRIVDNNWRQLPERFKHVVLDEWIVMPNHVQAIVWLLASGQDRDDINLLSLLGLRNREWRSSEQPPDPKGPPPGSLGAIVGSFKSKCSDQINHLLKTSGESIWQRGYHEEILRNERHLQAVRVYIRNNPANWDHDPDNPTYRA